jgi:hypothetical protein
MALQSKERYEPRKIERLIEHLRLYSERAQPIDYEIIVDGFKVVRRTSDLAMFTLFESFVDADTKSMEVLLYTGASNNNDKRIFYFGEPPKEGLSGLDIDARIDEQVQRKLKEKESDTLRQQNEELRLEIRELEKDVEQLQKEKADLEASQSPLKGFLGEIGSSFVESFIRRNPNIVRGIPGGEALAGLIENDNQRKAEEHEENVAVSFQPGGRESVTNPEDQAAITFVNQLKAQFDREEFDNLLIILQALADDKSKIPFVLSQLNVKQP